MAERDTIQTCIVIAGAGCGGAAAAIQAARAGASVVLVEPTPWPGGMLTSAGVVAFDGNLGTLTCGFYGELVREIQLYYGGAAKVWKGWVTRTAFEPRVLAEIFNRLIAREPLIRSFFGVNITGALREGNRVAGLTFRDGEGVEHEVRAAVTIDATEFGDLIEMAGIEHRFGREARGETGEPDAPETGDTEIQDATLVAILKDYRATEGRDAPPAPTTPDYNPAAFRGATALDPHPGCEGVHTLHTWETFIDYGKLPNHKYMINWPFHANDFADGTACFPAATRADAFRRAREHTLNFVRYMQTVLGHPELGVADDEYPTPDGLPFIPYIRESRRIVGDRVMREQDVLPGCGNGTRPPLQKDAIAAGDYFLDHHHARAHPGPGQVFTEEYPSNAKFQIPAGVLFPRGIDGFMAAEKSISVTHIVNGCTRLQPVVLLTGQAAGLLAAMAAKAGVEPRRVPVRDLQEHLLVRGVMLHPYDDLRTDDHVFVEAQKLALAGVVPDNEGFRFEGDRPVDWGLATELIAKASGCDWPHADGGRGFLRKWCDGIKVGGREDGADALDLPDVTDATGLSAHVTRAALAAVLCGALGLKPVAEVAIRFIDMPHTHPAARFIEPLYRLGLYEGIWPLRFAPETPVTRAELTLMLDRAFDPFRRLPV